MSSKVIRSGRLAQNDSSGSKADERSPNPGRRMPRRLVIGLLLILALFAFELFNFDTTRYALQSLLGDVRIVTLSWAAILAVAFCAIDFAGLARLFTPERGMDEPKEIWYLMGAWLLGATMNAVMTWWAVSLTLLDSQLGNEILSREEILRFVPVFVAALVWLTRILFIGALTVTGERLLYQRKMGSTPRRVKMRSNGSSNGHVPVPVRAQGTAMPGLTPQPVDLAAAPARENSRTLGRIRRPSQPLRHFAKQPPARGAQVRGPRLGNSG